MSKQTHTPGPWIAHEDGNVTSFGGGSVEMHVAKATGSLEIANARLIAAAPDLLEALTCLVNHASVPGHKGLPEALEIARTALAQAKGE